MSLWYYSSMFRALLVVFSVSALSVCAMSQTAVQKIVDSEHASRGGRSRLGRGHHLSNL